jgi:hypothetical protein
MAGRNVEVADFHGGNMTIISGGENLFTRFPCLPADFLFEHFEDNFAVTD